MSAYRKFIFASDIHGDEKDDNACDVLFKMVDSFNPDIRICGGDLFDMRPLRKGASAEEQRQSIERDIEAGTEWFNTFKPNYFLRGNHDERLWELAADGSGLCRDFARGEVKKFGDTLKQHGCRMLPYHKRRGILRIGDRNFLHGFNTGVNAARQTAIFYGLSIFGHCHNDDHQSIAGLTQREATCSSCLCNLDMDFEARKPGSLRHNHGFVFGAIHKRTGTSHIWSAKKIDGHWLIPSDIVEL